MKTVIFQQMRVKPTKLKNVFATTVGEMYPVRLCLHILPDVLWHGGSGSWSDLSLGVWEVSGFFLFKFRILSKPAGSSQLIAGPETGLILQIQLFLPFRPRNPAKPVFRVFLRKQPIVAVRSAYNDMSH